MSSFEKDLHKAGKTLFSNVKTEAEKVKDFYKNYEANHKLCPNCGSEMVVMGMSAYAVDLDNPDNFQDRNPCECIDCNHIHTVHDRISKEFFKYKEIMNLHKQYEEGTNEKDSSSNDFEEFVKNLRVGIKKV